MDAISTIGQRIAQIQSLVADPAQAVSATTTGGASSASAASGTAFAAVLAQALAAGTSSADATSSGSLLDSLGLGSSAAGLTGSSGGTGSSDLSALGLSGTAASGTALSGGGVSSLLAALGLSGVSGASGATTPGATSAAAAAGGRLDANGVPAELASYGNGRIPAAALAPVGSTGARMWQPAAQALTGLIAAAKADGVTIGVTEGYRPYDEQVSLAKSEGLYSQGGLAAVPGTSEHGWGLAADLRLDGPALTWMRANAGRFGFVADVPRESWHWAYHPASA